MIKVCCPDCASADIEDVSEQTIFPDEILQDFKCNDCDTVFEVTYAPIAIKKIVNVGD